MMRLDQDTEENQVATGVRDGIGEAPVGELGAARDPSMRALIQEAIDDSSEGRMVRLEGASEVRSFLEASMPRLAALARS